MLIDSPPEPSLSPDPPPGRSIPIPARMRSRRRRTHAIRTLRKVAAAGLVAAAALAALTTLRPAAPPTREVMVAARDLPAGTALGRADVREATRPAACAPEGAALPPNRLKPGSLLAAPVVAGESLTATRVIQPGAAPPAGRARMVVYSGSPGLPSVEAGSRVTLFVGGRSVAERVTVLAPLPGGDGSPAAALVELTTGQAEALLSRSGEATPGPAATFVITG